VEDDKVFETIETKKKKPKTLFEEEEEDIIGEHEIDQRTEAIENLQRLLEEVRTVEPIEELSLRIASLQIRETMTLQECKVCFEDVKASTIIKFDGETHDIC